MTHLMAGSKIVIASYNKGKIQEITELLTPFGISIIPAERLGLPETEETGVTFSANAVCKARAAARIVGCPVLADDSGLSVTALDGAPGLYSARWAKAEQSFVTAMLKIHIALGKAQDRSASFICALALAWPEGHTRVFEGDVQGSIIWPPRGSNGFGYDPIFQPYGHTLTFSEMNPEVKKTLSHRTCAFNKLAAVCLQSQ